MKTLNIGDSYKHLDDTYIVTARQGGIVLAECEGRVEVFRVIKYKPRILPNSTTSPGGEYPPSTKAWGNWSGHWLIKGRERAVEYFDELVLLQSKPKSKVKSES